MLNTLLQSYFKGCWVKFGLAMLCLIALTGSTLAEPSFKARIIVTTDITNEPDDQQSLVRLLLYSNSFDIEGLIGSTGIWKLSDPATHVIHQCIDAYGKVRGNLVLHDREYPTEAYLHSITVTGNIGYGMSAVGYRASKGANMIIKAVDRDDPRPVWLLAWGGANTIAQALWTVMHTRSLEETAKFANKIRVYDLAAQDDAGAWMAKTFPNLFIIRNVVAFKGMSNRYSSTAWDHTRGGDESVVSKDWVRRNIQHKHGPLGKQYPEALHIWEGDTPTYFYLMPNGLNDPEKQWQGSWGGRFSREKMKNVNIVAQEYAGADCSKGCFVNEEPYLDYWMYADAPDRWTHAGTIYENVWCSIFRWRIDFQNDFAARMDWCVKPLDAANHNPVAVINGDETKQVLYREAKKGSSVQIDAASSHDPDDDQLSYQWWIYQEAGTYKGKVTINDAFSSSASVEIPADAQRKTIHVILTLRDHGQPQLTSYRRMVISGIE